MNKFVFFVLAVFLCISAGCNPRESIEAILTGDYVVGTISGNNFESEWLGLRFTAPDGFVMASQQEIMEMMQLGLDMLDADGATVAWAEMATVSEMMAMLPDATASASLITERLLLSGITIEQYVATSFQQLEEMTGWDITFNNDITEIDFAGNTWHTYTANIHAFGVNYSYQYIIHKFGNRMAIISIYSLLGEEENIDILMNAFQSY